MGNMGLSSLKCSGASDVRFLQVGVTVYGDSQSARQGLRKLESFPGSAHSLLGKKLHFI